VLSKLALPSVHSLLHLLQSASPDILIYSEDIIGPVSFLKHLSVLVILQSLLNLQAELDYLREHYPSRFHLGWSLHYGALSVDPRIRTVRPTRLTKALSQHLYVNIKASCGLDTWQYQHHAPTGVRRFFSQKEWHTSLWLQQSMQ